MFYSFFAISLLAFELEAKKAWYEAEGAPLLQYLKTGHDFRKHQSFEHLSFQFKTFISNSDLYHSLKIDSRICFHNGMPKKVESNYEKPKKEDRLHFVRTVCM